MIKLYITITLLTQLLFSASSEQIEQYLLVSNAETELISLEAQFSKMQNGFRPDSNASKNKTYDMQLITVRFKEYLESHISDDEMEKILSNYRNVIMLQYVSAVAEVEVDKNVSKTYITKLMSDTDASVRVELVKQISDGFYSKEAMSIMFEELMMPLMKNGNGGSNIKDAQMKLHKENYLKQVGDSASTESLFLLRDFSMEELEALLDIAKTPAVGYESKAVHGATAFALKEFFLSMAPRYDVSKHQAASDKRKKEKVSK
jgi:hypothetical protein